MKTYTSGKVGSEMSDGYDKETINGLLALTEVQLQELISLLKLGDISVLRACDEIERINRRLRRIREG